MHPSEAFLDKKFTCYVHRYVVMKAMFYLPKLENVSKCLFVRSSSVCV